MHSRPTQSSARVLRLIGDETDWPLIYSIFIPRNYPRPRQLSLSGNNRDYSFDRGVGCCVRGLQKLLVEIKNGRLEVCRKSIPWYCVGRSPIMHGTFSFKSHANCKQMVLANHPIDDL